MEKQAIIIDNGSFSLKAGLVGDDQPDYPSVCFPNIYGVLKDTQIVKGVNDHYFWIGDDIINNKGLIKVSHPVVNGVITNWNQMEKVFNYTFFNELRKDPQYHPVLVSDSPLNNDQNREKMTQMMFEKFQVPCFALSNQAILAIYSSGRTTGLVVDSGQDNTISTPIYEGQVMKDCIVSNKVAGDSCNQFLKDILREINLHLTSFVEQKIVREIKEKVCHILERPDIQNYEPKKFQLPDGSHIQILTQQFRCPEILFQPMINNLEQKGVHQVILQSLEGLDKDTLNEMFGNIILSGGTTKFQGYETRLLREIKKQANQKQNVKLVAYKERENMVWIGGQIISELYQNANLFITGKEYKEQGPSIIHKKMI